MSAEPLRRKAVRAGVHLTLRRIVGLVLSVVGVLYLTRIVGPEAYGAFAAAGAVLGYFLAVGANGGRIYLIRQPEGTERALFDTTFWWLLALGVGISVLLIGWGIALLAVGYHEVQFATALAAMGGVLPLGLTRGVPAALLERDLEYGKLAVIEVSGQLLFYAVGIPLALSGAGVWALVAASWSSEVLQTLWMFVGARYVPHRRLDKVALQESVRESLKMSGGAWTYELRRFSVPMVLLPLGGERAVGYYALAERLISSLTFVSSAILQLSTPIYAKLQERPTELLRAIHLSAQAQVISFGAFAMVAILLGQVVLTRLFDDAWDIQIVLLTAAVSGVQMILYLLFGTLAQALYVIRKTDFMFWLNASLIAYLFPIVWFFTWIVPEPYKPVGFMLGYLLAHQPNQLMLHRAVNRWIGKPIYGMNLVWAAGLGAAMFAPFTGYWALLGLLVFVHPASLQAARATVALLKESREGRRTASSD